GQLETLHRFKDPSEGFGPNELVAVDAKLFGTTYGGGVKGRGVVFSMSSSGVERVLYHFRGAPDGSNPNTLISLSGTLYGTTAYGGTYGKGTVFEISATGQEHVVYSFKGGADASMPNGLIGAGHELYGTSEFGGRHGVGSVFEVTLGGSERLLHSFENLPGGRLPAGGLIEVNHQLYGTTSEGCKSGAGMVFGLSLAGKEQVLGCFRSSQTFDLNGRLVDAGGILYGTSVYGGSGSCPTYPGEPGGCGSVFALTSSGRTTLLHDFQGVDGAFPGGLVEMNGTLYGTTSMGGSSNSGTIFAVLELRGAFNVR
ncbi:MAG TPA: choice-of-anchor tandem repeat GloVer-containing protein, partial [Candidatus Acidoferrales bacterium]|nr:choice-of-anchor tandem repeat GloVer-containing protein [Candidatus Acidoferrales bacterium]